MSQSLSTFKIETPCSRGEDGYFELQNSNGLTDCIQLALPNITYLDKEGNILQIHPLFQITELRLLLMEGLVL